VQRERGPDRRTRRDEQLFELAPDALGGRIVERDRAAERRRLLLERERKARGELRGAQDAQAVVGKCRRIDDAEQATLEIGTASEWIEILAGQRIEGDRVDR